MLLYRPRLEKTVGAFRTRTLQSSLSVSVPLVQEDRLRELKSLRPFVRRWRVRIALRPRSGLIVQIGNNREPIAVSLLEAFFGHPVDVPSAWLCTPVLPALVDLERTERRPFRHLDVQRCTAT